MQDILKAKLGIQFPLTPTINFLRPWCLGNRSIFHKELASAQLSSPWGTWSGVVTSSTWPLSVLLLEVSLTRWHIPMGGGVMFCSQPLPSPYVSSLNISIWILFQVTLLCGWPDLMLLRQVLWNAFTVREGGNRTKMSLMGCMAISADFLAFTGMSHSSRTISNLCMEASHYLPLAPSPRPVMTKNAQVFKQSFPWMKIKNSFKKTIPVKVSLQQDNPSLLAGIYLHCVCYGLVLQTVKTKQTKQRLPLHFELHCTSMEIVLSFLWLQQNKSIYTTVGFESQVWSISTS